MPVSKKRKKDPARKKRHEELPAPHTGSGSSQAVEPVAGGGLLTRMRGGLQNVAGAGPKKAEPLWSKILTYALIAVAAYFVAKRFGIIP